MIFKYLRLPSFADLMQSKDCFRYWERSKQILGWSPPARRVRLWWLYYLWTTVIAITAVFYIPMVFIVTYTKEFKNLTASDLFSSLQGPINCFAGITKAIVIFFARWRFLRIWELLDQLDNRCTRTEDRFLIHRTAARCNLIVLIYHATYFAYLSLATLNGLLVGKTPYRLYNPIWNWEENATSRCLATLVEFYLITCAVMMNLMSDAYPVIFALIMRAHIKVLENRINGLRMDLDKSEEGNYKELVNCIEDHKLIRDYSDVLRPVIAKTMFVQLLCVGLLLGFSMVYLLFYAKGMEAIVCLADIAAIVLQSFPFCFICNQLETDSQKLALAIFHSNWNGTSRRYRLTLLLLLHNAQKTIEFDAGGIFPICVNTNIRMAKLAFSVVTFVDQMNLGDKLK